MHEAVKAHFQPLEDAVRTTAITAERKQLIAMRVGRLSGLYTKLRQTHESRYFDEISGLVQLVLRELEACPDAQKLDLAFRTKLRHLHEELGLPLLSLKAPPAPKKASRKREKVHPV
jgi:hypothetical protein